jgi:hypothetical protein
MLRWVQVQANDIGSLLFKLRIITSHVPIQPMRFQIGFLPDLPNQILAHVHHRRHFAQRPVRGSVWWRLLRLGQDPCSQLSGQLLCRLSRMEGRQPYDPFLAVTPLPQGDGRGGRVELLLNIVIARAFVQHQHDSHTHRHTCRKAPLPQIRVQFSSPSRG